jgi:IS4 transposase
LYRVRWQIELLFKLWKSQGRLDKSLGHRGERVLCEVLAKLLVP